VNLLFYNQIKPVGKQHDRDNDQTDTNRIQWIGNTSEISFRGMRIQVIIFCKQPDDKKNDSTNDEIESEPYFLYVLCLRVVS
jgi:hypothetical protein